MEPTEFYRKIVDSISDLDIRRVARVMSYHIGEENKISLERLALEAFGKYTQSTERKTREILEKLTKEHHMPVCAGSGKPGRWLARTAEERDSSATELENRARETLDRAKALRQAGVPAKEPQFDGSKQPGLWR